MALSLPRYVRLLAIRDNVLRYKWDDWNVEQAEEPIDEVLFKRLVGISYRADVAFTIGTAEWIVFRFTSLCNDALLLQYLEAAWAQLIDLHYGGIRWDNFTAAQDWTGPVKCPLKVCMNHLADALEEADEGDEPAFLAALVANLAKYVITDPRQYLTWQERALNRLEVLYRRDSEESLGEVIPKEVLDPDRQFSVEQTEVLINRFLRALDYRSNPFLNSPERMVEKGFAGTPYRFNIEDDRRARFEW
jgi:hypothetical protein